MATHSSVLAWRIPGTAEPGGLPPMGAHSRTRLKRLSSSSFSCFSSQARERGAQQVWPTGLVAPWHVGSSQIRDQICVSHTGRQILNHWTTREVLIRFSNQPDQCYRGLYRKWLTLVIRLSVVGVRPCMDSGFNEYWGSLERGPTTYVRNFTGSALFASQSQD